MKLLSKAFIDGNVIPAKYTCDGPNINPPLSFEDIPLDTRSLALAVKDLNATPKPWIHWLVFNIPPTITAVAEGTIPPQGTEGNANGGTKGYEGPCPRYFSGTHTYRFELYALDEVLDVPDSVNFEAIEPLVKQHAIDTALLTGTRSQQDPVT